MGNMIIDAVEQIKNILAGTPNAGLKQAQVTENLKTIADNLTATTAHPGVIQLATNTEAAAKTVTNKALTPGNIASFLTAFASDTEAKALTIATKAINPSTLGAVLTDHYASDAQALAMTATDKYLTPKNMAAILAALNDIQFAASKGPILVAPDLSLHRLKVANDGSLSTEVVTP
jgi:hypothetical protein